MSLFTFKDLWTAEYKEGFSAYSSGSIITANIDNSSDNSIKFVLGSLSGILRVIGHRSYEDPNDTSACLLAELNLGSPILQLESAIFIGGSKDLSLAVLHPFKLAIYGVTKLPGQVEHGSQYKVALLYEHQLKRHAFNMCCGPFGHGPTESKKDKTTKKQSRSFICVQSLDGTLSFFEQELCTFCRYLPGFLLPGPLAYAPTWDSFITTTSAWTLVCFKYSSLAMSKDDPYQQQGQDTTVGKRLTPDWSISIGEECIGDIQVLCTEDPATSCVVVCTFRNIMCFGDGGILVWTKHLEYQVGSIHSFLVPFAPNSNEHECITVATSNGEPYICYVYGGTTLRWAAKLPLAPVHVSRVFNYKGINGALLLLSCDGTLTLGCLGTVPSLFAAPAVNARELDYEAAEKELSSLRKAIAAAGDQPITADKDTTVEIKMDFEGQRTRWLESNGLEVASLVGSVNLNCHLKVNDVRVTFNTPRPITCSPGSVFIGDIVGKHTYQVEFYVESEAVPSDLILDMFVFYISDNGSPHFVRKTGIRIPLFVVARPYTHLEKYGEIKLTFSVNKPVVNLQAMYNDFQWNTETETPVPGLSFKLCNGEVVSLLSSTKNASSDTSKYRIQSQTLAGVHLLFKDFLDRLHRKQEKDKSDLSVEPLGFEEEISLLDHYFHELDTHAMQRQRDAQMKIEISDRAAQLRAIQRRLLIRFRDKNPLPLTQLETLFEGSLDQIGDCLNFIEGNDQEMYKTECRLSGATKLFLELIKVKHDKNIEGVSLLSSILSPDVWNFAEESGWEETVYTALNYIRGGAVVNQSLANLDNSKLKRAIRSAIEKAWKDTFKKKISNDEIKLKPKEEEKAQELLIGNEIQERMASARARTARHRMVSTLAVIPEPNIETDESMSLPPEINNPKVDIDGENDVHLKDGDMSQPDLNHTLVIRERKHHEENGVMSCPAPDGEVPDDNFW